MIYLLITSSHASFKRQKGAMAMHIGDGGIQKASQPKNETRQKQKKKL